MSDDVAGHKKTGSWRQRAGAHIAAVQAELNRIEKMAVLSAHDKKLAEKAHQLLHGARQATDSWPFWAGASARDRTLATIHEAELIVLKLTPAQELGWEGSSVLAKGIQHLGQEDPRLKLLEEHLRENDNMLDVQGRHLAAGVLHAANHTEEIEIARVRNFRNILILTFLALSAFTVLLILSGYQNPAALADKLCFEPPAPTRENLNRKDYVCPVDGPRPADGDNVLLVASLGAAAAALAGATSIRHIHGSAVPYMVPMSLLILRIPIGALSAILGLVLIHGEFIPGLSALDSGAQIAAWAVAFGIGQEGLTRLLDKKGNLLLENVRGSARAVDSPPPRTDRLIKPVIQPSGPNGAKPGGDGAAAEEEQPERAPDGGEEAAERTRPEEAPKRGGDGAASADV
ncbi:hypothetical protein [Streptomyces cupreus]|uniref:Uncharacterized protein n=1 Tax=Streptomyces cupreus TaxID=2759956 RepID=A0A7X1J1S5_9ACTN|nr:hypothetical protein [Streptomyces cupreus]MBC2902519.1 hypothetical protein [Streptomyces cupreus]